MVHLEVQVHLVLVEAQAAAEEKLKQELDAAKDETSKKIKEVEKIVEQINEDVVTLDDTDKSNYESKLTQIEGSLTNQKNSLAACTDITNLQQINTEVARIEKEATSLDEDVGEAMLEKAAADAKKEEAVKISQPLPMDQVNELSQKGGNIFEKLKSLSIPKALHNFLNNNISSAVSSQNNEFIKKIKDSALINAIQPYDEKLTEKSENYNTASDISLEVIQEVNKLKAYFFIELSTDKSVTSLKSKGVDTTKLELFDNYRSLCQKIVSTLAPGGKGYIFETNAFLQTIKSNQKSIVELVEKIYSNGNNIFEILKTMLLYNFDTIIRFIAKKITPLDHEIKQAESKLTESSPLTGSVQRHTFVINAVQKFKQNCEVLILRLENVKAMIGGLRTHFEENEIVKNYLKPSQEQTTKVTAFVPTTSFLHSLTTYQKLKESLTTQTLSDDDLTNYKNAFITLSFQIASTLFGYGISVLQIFMQNFPEQMCSFNDDTRYGLKQLDTLKQTFEIFTGLPSVNSPLVKSDEFELDNTNYSTNIRKKITKPTPFSTLVPFGPTNKIENMPLFQLPTLYELTTQVGFMGGSNRPKKRKTIKNKLNSVKKISNKKKTIKKGNRKRKISIIKSIIS